MAFLDGVNQLSNVEPHLYLDSPFKTENIGVKIDGIETDVLISDYSNRLLVLITQYEKPGTFLQVCKETAKAVNGCGDVFTVSPIFGEGTIEYHAAVRYLYEQTHMVKPALFSICLKNNSLRTLKALKEIIIKHKTW